MEEVEVMEEGRAERVSLLALFWTFLKIGSTAWGGFMALMEDPDGNVFYLDQISAAHG